jgi:DNA-binding CsgD family transcriptional regulator/PAS domain-containing protein
MEDIRTIILPPAAAIGDDFGLRQLLELFAECTDTRWAELAIRTRGEERVIALGKPTGASISMTMTIDEEIEAVVTLAGNNPPSERVLDLFASNLGLELQRLRLHAESELLQSAANSADAAILIFGTSGNILFANHRADALISNQTENELTIDWKTEHPQPLFRLLCAKVGEMIETTPDEPWRDWVEVSDGSELTIEMVVLAVDNGVFISSVMAILREVAGPPDQRVDEFAAFHQLSPRERDVLRLLVQGHDTAGLADHLGISPHTVRDHLKNVFRKTTTRSRSELLSALAGAGNHVRQTD